MNAPDNEPTESQSDGSDTPEVSHDSHAVPPPVQSEVDALVDAVSAGGRPRIASELEWFAEEDRPDASSLERPRYDGPPPPASMIPAGAFQFAAASVAAFVLGVVIAIGVLRSFDYSQTPVAVNAPATPANRAPARVPVEPPPAPVTSPAPAPQAPAVDTAPVETLAINVPPQPRTPAPITAPASTAKPIAEAARSVAAPPARTDAPPREAPAAGAVTAPPAVAAAPPPAPPPPPAVVETAPAPPAVVATRPAAPTIVTPSSPAPAIPPPAPAAAAAAARSMAAIEQNAVIATVREYTQAYRAMDVTAAAAVWPSVDRRALARAFATLKSQQLDLRDCEVTISDTSATARCRGKLEYVRKVGDPTPRTGNQEWVFKMRKLGDEWIIDGLDASPVAALLPTPDRKAS
jgi:hypothetical protein